MTQAEQTPGADEGQGREGRRFEGVTRSRRQKVVGGVCGGLGRYLGIDPVVFRVVLAVLALTGGVGLIAYGIGWLLIPLDGEDETELHRLLTGRIEGTALTALLCVLVGSGLFLSTLDNGDTQAFSLCLLGVTAGAVYWSRRRRTATAGVGGEAYATAANPVADAPPAAQPPPADAPSWWREPLAKTAPGRPGRYLWGPDDGPGEPGGGYTVRTAVGGPLRERPQAVRPERRQRSLFGAATFALAVAAAATAISLAWHHRPLGTVLEIGLIAALCVLGLGLLVGAFLGRCGGGTVFWAVLTSALLAASAALPGNITTDWHHTLWHPTATAQVQPRYELGSGQGDLDLSAMRLGGGALETTADVGAGRLRVMVPADAVVDVTARVGLGDVELPVVGPHHVRIEPGQERTAHLVPPAGVKPSGTIKLTLQVGVGQVEVIRGAAS